MPNVDLLLIGILCMLILPLPMSADLPDSDVQLPAREVRRANSQTGPTLESQAEPEPRLYSHLSAPFLIDMERSAPPTPDLDLFPNYANAIRPESYFLRAGDGVWSMHKYGDGLFISYQVGILKLVLPV